MAQILQTRMITINNTSFTAIPASSTPGKQLMARMFDGSNFIVSSDSAGSSPYPVTGELSMQIERDPASVGPTLFYAMAVSDASGTLCICESA